MCLLLAQTSFSEERKIDCILGGMTEKMQRAMHTEEIPTVEQLHKVAKSRDAWSDHGKSDGSLRVLQSNAAMEIKLNQILNQTARSPTCDPAVGLQPVGYPPSPGGYPPSPVVPMGYPPPAAMYQGGWYPSGANGSEGQFRRNNQSGHNNGFNNGPQARRQGNQAWPGGMGFNQGGYVNTPPAAKQRALANQPHAPSRGHSDRTNNRR